MILPPIPVAGPLAVAGLLLAAGPLLPRRAPDIVALLTALAACAVCFAMLQDAAAAPLVYWFGGWVPHDGQVLGIGFVVDQAGAALATFVALLFAASILFAWGFFTDVGSHFHVLMLLFMAAMIGFCLTHDLFNLFVWFEVMSVAGFALTAYALRTDALEGALNFTLVNSIGSYLILAGIGLIYARVGALDFSALAAGVAARPNDPVASAAFALVACGLLIKGAQVPFQFWLADAHAVSPSPVSVIFSGAMVAMGLFGVARLTHAVFPDSAPVQGVVRTLLLGMGATTAVLGGVMALLQRHIKRLLAFSTISHVGLMLAGLALLDPQGLAGMLLYMVGHGLVKAALFMVAGILLATCGGIDELGLRGRGRAVWPAGLVMAAGGLLLAGLPLGLMDGGLDLVRAAAQSAHRAWLLPVLVVAGACTGGAVLRVAGRVFLNLGPVAGEEECAPTDDEQESANRPLWLMMIPTTLLLLLAVPATHAASDLAQAAALQMIHPETQAIIGLPPLPPPILAPTTLPPPPPLIWLPWLSVTLAISIAALQLSRRSLPAGLVAAWDTVARPPVNALQSLHSGLIGDYATWLVIGVALFACAFAWV